MRPAHGIQLSLSGISAHLGALFRNFPPRRQEFDTQAKTARVHRSTLRTLATRAIIFACPVATILVQLTTLHYSLTRTKVLYVSIFYFPWQL